MGESAEYEPPQTIPTIDTVLTKLRGHEITSPADFPPNVDFSPWFGYFDRIFREGYTSKAELAWGIEEDRSGGTELVSLGLGTDKQVNFVEGRRNHLDVTAEGHNHPVEFPFRLAKMRDAQADPRVSDFFSITDLMETTNSSGGIEPAPVCFVVHGGHVSIAFRTEQTPRITRAASPTFASYAAQEIQYFAELNAASLTQRIMDRAANYFHVENELGKHMTEDSARRLNKSTAKRWHLALYEINNFFAQDPKYTIGRRFA